MPIRIGTLKEQFELENRRLRKRLAETQAELVIAQQLLDEQVLYQPSISTPTRVFNTPFQTNMERPVLGFYVVSLTATSSFVGGQAITIRILSDTNPNPITERCRGHLSLTQGLGVNANLQSQQAVSLSYLIPAGHYVSLASSGTGTGVLVASTEITF